MCIKFTFSCGVSRRTLIRFSQKLRDAYPSNYSLNNLTATRSSFNLPNLVGFAYPFLDGEGVGPSPPPLA